MSLLLFFAGNSINPAFASRYVRTTLYKANKNVIHKQKERVVKNKLNIVEHCTQCLVQLY